VRPFSTGMLFPDCAELENRPWEDRPWMWPIRATYDPMIVYRPRTWLLAEGWKLCGSISARDVPSKPR